MSCKHAPEFKAKIVLAVIRGDRELGKIALVPLQTADVIYNYGK